MPNTPRLTLLKDTLSDELKTIVPGDVYFNKVERVVRGLIPPKDIPVIQDLHACLIASTRKHRAIDDVFTKYEQPTQIVVQFVKCLQTSVEDEMTEADARLEEICQDAETWVKSITTKYISNAQNKWNVSQEDGPPETFPYILTADQAVRCCVILMFNVKLRNVS